MITLEGITWNHTRGFVPKVAAAQRFSELNPDIEIRWSKRSLLEFGEFPVEKLAERFDLLIIDHPYIGFGAEQNVFLPMDGLLPAATLETLARQSVGASHASYHWRGRQWALAVDTACPVAHWRSDLLEAINRPVPRTWADVKELIGAGKVIAPLIHTDALHVFFMFCHALGEEPFVREDPQAEFVSREIGLAALETGRELAAALPARCQKMNPIAVLEELSRGDQACYCPFAFGYINYARPGYSLHVVDSGPAVEWRENLPLKTTLGGTGIAISHRCKTPDVAARFAAYIASADIQKGLYFDSGGQPANALAWTDERLNADTRGAFTRMRPALERAWVRPRYCGFLHFQDHAAYLIASVFAGELPAARGWERMQGLYQESVQIFAQPTLRSRPS